MTQEEEEPVVEPETPEVTQEPKVAEVAAPVPAAGSENEKNESKGEPMDEVVEEVSKASEITEL